MEELEKAVQQMILDGDDENTINSFIKSYDLGKTKPTTQKSAEDVDVTAALDTDLPSVDTSLDLQGDKKDKELQQEAGKKLVSGVTGVPEFLVPTIASLGSFASNTAAGLVDFAEKYGYAPMKAAIKVGGIGVGPNATLAMAEYEKIAAKNNIDVSELYEFGKTLENLKVKKFDEQGNEQDVYGLIEKCNYADAAELAVNEAVGSAPSLALSIAFPVVGSSILGMSTAGQEFERELKENPNESVAKIAGASLLKGAAETGTEYLGGIGARYVGGLANNNMPKKVIKDFASNYFEKGFKSIAAAVGGVLTEGTTEGVTALAQTFVDDKIYEDDIDSSAYWREFANSAIIGGLLGGPVSGATKAVTISNLDKGSAYRFIAPQEWKKQVAKIDSNISDAKQNLQNAPQRKKKQFQNQIEVLEQQKQNRINNLTTAFDNLSKKELLQYTDNVSKIDNAISQIGNNKYTDFQQQQAKIDLREAANFNENLVGKETYDAEVEESIGRILKNRERIAEAASKIKDIDKKDIKIKYLEEAVSEDDAIFLKTEQGQTTIFINTPVAELTGQTNVLGHELLHYIINNKFKTDNESIKPLVDSFKDYLKETQPEVFQRVEERINNNYKDSKGNIKEGALEEYFNVFSDLIAKEKIEVNESISDKIKNTTTRFLNGLGFGSVKLETGKDVFNFIRNYQKNISNFKFKQLGVDVKSSKIPLAIQKEVSKFSRTEASEKVQQIYEEQGVEGAMDIIDVFQPIVNKLVNKYKNVPGFDYQILKDEIETGKRGILDMIMEYTPEKAKGAPLAGYINKFLSRRAIEVANRNLDTDFKLDVTEAKGVTDTTTEEVTERVEEVNKPKIESLRKKMKIGDEIKPVVFDAVRKTFGTKIPEISDKNFRKELEKSFRVELKKPIAKLMGRTEAYRSFLANNFETIYDALPQSVINRRLNEFADPVMKDGKQVREKTAEGKKVFTKKKITKAEWIKYFLGSEVGRSTQGTRKTALAEALAETFALDATMEVLSNSEAMQRVKDIGELQDINIPNDFIDQVSKIIGRPVDFKFSRSSTAAFADKFGLEYYDISDKKNIDIYVKSIENITKAPYYPQGLLNGSMMMLDRSRFGSKENLVYARNKFKSINFGSNKAFAKTKPNSKFGGSLEVIREKATPEAVELYNERNSEMFDTFWNFLNRALNDPNYKDDALAVYLMLEASTNERGHPHPLGAEIVSIDEKSNGKAEWEHAVQNAWAYNFLINAAMDPSIDFSKALKALKKNYKLVALSRVENDKITKAGYKDSMPLINGADWDIYKDFWWQRYLNEDVASIDGGINVLNQKWFSNEQNPFEQYNNKGIQIKASRSLDTEFNQLLQATTGIEYYKEFSPAKARLVGRGKGKRKFFIPYSADDFVGLLYATLGKGKVGDKQMAWYEENLLRPFSRGIQQYEAAKQKAMREWMVLSSQIKKDVPGGLNKRNETGFRNQDSLRMYIWAKQGMDVPGAAKSDINESVSLVNNNPKLKEFAERLIALNPEGYPAPGQSWDAGDITTDIVSYVNDVRRGEFLTEWKKNVDQIFTDKNKQKLLASYGQNYVDALEDILHRMKTGRNRKFGITKAERTFMDWTNNSVGAIMFFNARSAVLQTLSAVNFINFSDNNPINAGLAFANQPQYWKDFATLFNSDFLKQRRTGLQTDVNADEIANAAKSSTNKAKAALSAILKLGFTPTQIADSFAIASGGATFYRNRVKKYIKEGSDKEAAEKKAFTDFQEVAEETQQSARPDRISMQQASSLGRLILAFGNTPMQYARLTKKAALDLINGRGDWKTNISKIAYYSVIQNIIFSALQQGLFALLFDEEDEEKEKSRYFRIGNSSIDTLLRGSGVYGAAAATVKNMILEIIEQSEKSRPDYTKVAIEATTLSPPINSKLRKLESAGKTFTYKQSKEKVFTEGFSFENPAFLAGGRVISAVANLPVDRVVQKADHIHTAMQDETELWQAIALSLGWSEWDLNMIEKKSSSKTLTIEQTRKLMKKNNRGVKKLMKRN